ncbi:hypothetical protein AHX77_004490 [Salmonella enterica subsp. enterica]|nr:hypothetical protein [Salmonella enterica subsp. enterica]
MNKPCAGNHFPAYNIAGYGLARKGMQVNEFIINNQPVTEGADINQPFFCGILSAGSGNYLPYGKTGAGKTIFIRQILQPVLFGAAGRPHNTGTVRMK